MAIVTFSSVSKYFVRHAGQKLLRDRLINLVRPAPRERFYALRDVSFAVERGQSIGIVGHNGAGKSTLLNITTALCSPSEGSVSINGRVAALLELGLGIPSGPHRRRERPHQRRAAGTVTAAGARAFRRDRRVLGHRRIHRRTAAHVFFGNDDAAGVLGRDQRRSRIS